MPDAVYASIASDLDQAAMRMARALEAFTEFDKQASGHGGKRRPFLLGELAAALEHYLSQMTRSIGMGEHALDTVYYFRTPTVDRLIGASLTPSVG